MKKIFVILISTIILLASCGKEPDFVDTAVVVTGEHVRIENGAIIAGEELLDGLIDSESGSIFVVYVFETEGETPEVYSCELTKGEEDYRLTGDFTALFPVGMTKGLLSQVEP